MTFYQIKNTFFLLALFFLIHSPLEAKKQKHGIAIAAIFQNEAKWLKEWIEYHNMLGVTHFYLYNNLSNDHYREVLFPYMKKGLVSLIEWPYSYSEILDWGQIQNRAYDHALKRAKKECRWLSFLDIDEFLVPKKHKNLKEFLKNYEAYGGVIAHWQMFGTSNIAKIPADKLLIETLTRKAQPTHDRNRQIKTIVQPKYAIKVYNPHTAQFHPGYYQVNTRKQRLDGAFSSVWDLETLVINHYYFRDEDCFVNEKYPSRLKRAFNNSSSEYPNVWDYLSQFLEPFNEVEDTAILRFVPELRQRMKL